ncbi:MAG: hypothetical protein Q8919_03020 [Bacteroidota bacterium]|nr:hypothetical protein [Bacteroidota bacterium]
MLRIATILLLFCAQSAYSQAIEFVRPIGSVAHLLSIRQEQNLERTLGELFPARTLRRSARGIGKITEERITYDVLKQHGAKYAIVIFTGSWKQEVCQLAIFRIEAGGYPAPLHHSKCWQSNYADSYHEIQSRGFGKESVVLIKEGENGSSPFVIASVFTFRERKGSEGNPSSCSINDLTPMLPRLKALVDFPLKALYGQAVKLEKYPDHLRLQAADVELSWNKSNAAKSIKFWNYEKPSRKFVLTNEESVPVVDGR